MTRKPKTMKPTPKEQTTILPQGGPEVPAERTHEDVADRLIAAVEELNAALQEAGERADTSVQLWRRETEGKTDFPWQFNCRVLEESRALIGKGKQWVAATERLNLIMEYKTVARDEESA